MRAHDFIDRDLAIPYGVYDVARIEGWVNVGIDHDTASARIAANQMDDLQLTPAFYFSRDGSRFRRHAKSARVSRLLPR